MFVLNACIFKYIYIMLITIIISVYILHILLRYYPVYKNYLIVNCMSERDIKILSDLKINDEIKIQCLDIIETIKIIDIGTKSNPFIKINYCRTNIIELIAYNKLTLFDP
jgi:cell division protein FtsL